MSNRSKLFIRDSVGAVAFIAIIIVLLNMRTVPATYQDRAVLNSELFAAMDKLKPTDSQEQIKSVLIQEGMSENNSRKFSSALFNAFQANMSFNDIVVAIRSTTSYEPHTVAGAIQKSAIYYAKENKY